MESLTTDLGYSGGLERFGWGTLPFVAVRYLALLVEAGVLALLMAQMLWLGGNLSLLHCIEVALVSICCPMLVWVASNEERRLHLEREEVSRS